MAGVEIWFNSKCVLNRVVEQVESERPRRQTQRRRACMYQIQVFANQTLVRIQSNTFESCRKATRGSHGQIEKAIADVVS